MAENIGTLSAKISADAAPFLKSTSDVQGAARQTASIVKSAISNVGNIASSAAGFAGIPTSIGGMVDAVKEQFQQITDIGKAAHTLGADVKEFSGIAALAGSDVGAFTGALSHMNRSIGEARMGSTEAEKIFRTLGLTANELADASLPERLGVLADRLNAIGDPTMRQIEGFKIFGKQFKEINELIEKGSAGIGAAGSKANKRGLGFTEADLKDVKDAKRAIKDLEDSVNGALRQIAIAAAPFAKEVAQAIGEMTKNGIDFKGAATEGFKAALGGGADFLDLLGDIQKTFSDVNTSAEQFGKYIKLAQTISSIFTGGDLTAKGKEAVLGKPDSAIAAADRENPLKARAKHWRDIATGLSPFGGGPQTGPQAPGLDPALAEFLGRAEDMKKALKEQADMFGKTADEIQIYKLGLDAAKIGMDAKAFEDVSRGVRDVQDAMRASQIHDAFKSPLEGIQKDLDQLNRLLDAGTILAEEYGMEVTKAFAKIDHGAQQTKLPEMFTAGSQGALDLIHRTDNQANDPAAKIVAAITQQRENIRSSAESNKIVAEWAKAQKGRDLLK